MDDRVKPGQGEFCGGEGGKSDASEPEKLNRTAVGLTRPSTSTDRRNVAKKDVGGRVKPGQGVSVVVFKHHLATEFAEPDSRVDKPGDDGWG